MLNLTGLVAKKILEDDYSLEFSLKMCLDSADRAEGVLGPPRVERVGR